MPIIRCKTCGRTYSYEKQGMCPKCGAYNRPPRRERIDPDGSIHYLDDRSAITGAVPNHPRDKVCYEKKVCYEEQTKKPSFQDVENLVATFFPKATGKKLGRYLAIVIAVLVAALILINTIDFTPRQPEPDYPTEEAAVQYAGDTTVYQMDWYFDLMGETGQVAEVQTDGQRVIVTVEGLTSDTAPLPFLTAYDAGGNLLDLTAPIQFTMLDYGTEYIFDRSMYNAEDAAEWLLEFDVQEEQDGTMVYTGDVVAVDLTDALP